MLSTSKDGLQTFRLPRRRFGQNRPNNYAMKQAHLLTKGEHYREAQLAKGPHAGSTGRVYECWRLAKPLFLNYANAPVRNLAVISDLAEHRHLGQVSADSNPCRILVGLIFHLLLWLLRARLFQLLRLIRWVYILFSSGDRP